MGFGFASSIRAALAVIIIGCLYLSTKGSLKGIYNQAHQYDLACLSLAFTVFWAYISFSQYFLIYSANIPEETFWYTIREINPNTGERSGWFWVSMGLIFGHFFFPFFISFSTETKSLASVWFSLSLGFSFFICLIYIGISSPAGKSFLNIRRI